MSNAHEMGARLAHLRSDAACDLSVRVEVVRVARSSSRRVQVVLAVETDPGEADDVARSIRAAVGVRDGR